MSEWPEFKDDTEVAVRVFYAVAAGCFIFMLTFGFLAILGVI